nr:uncharacterized protein LOC109176261 [Ipomoea batatas]
MAYYTKKELKNIGLDGFAIIDEFYGGRKGGRKQHPNYGANAHRPLPPPPPAAAPATPFVSGNHYSTGSSSGYSRRVQYQGYNYRYSPSESHVGWAPVAAAVTAETTTVVRRGYEAGDADNLMDNYKY